MADLHFPNETEEYRAARKELLKAEIDLRARVAEIAAQRRKLPMGGAVKDDYAFRTVEGGAERDIRLSELFAPGKDTLFLYSFMYGRKQKTPCPSCTSFMDYATGGARHHLDRINFAICAAAPINEFERYAKTRGWPSVRLLSSSSNSYNRDYFAESDDGGQMPMGNVFVKRDGGVHHFWGSEMLHAGLVGHPRHMDQMWPLWNILDLTPEGRGESWGPKLAY